MTEHRPIKTSKDDESSSLLERASGAFGLNNLGAAPMPTSFDDVPMKRARPLRREERDPDGEPAPARAPVRAAAAS